MNTRVYELLKFLLTQAESTFSIDELADNFHVSTRTIRNYAKTIEDFLLNNKLEGLIFCANNKIEYKGNSQQKFQLLSLISKCNFYDYKLSVEERYLIISLMLLSSNGPITISDFSSSLFVDRGTIIKDLAFVSQQFSSYGILFEDNKNKGFFLRISESQRIDLICKLIYDFGLLPKEIYDFTVENIFTVFIRNRFDLSKFFHGIEVAVSLAEKHYNIFMTDIEFYDIIFLLSLMANKNFRGQSIENTYESSLNPQGNVFEISRYVLKLIYITNDPPKSDVAFLADRIKKYTLTYSNEIIGENSINFYIIVKSFLYKLSLIYGIMLLNDYKLQQFLSAHIIGVYTRYNNHEKLYNPYKEELLVQYSNDYQILKANSYILEDNLDIKLDDDELTYILMHIVAALERIRQKNIVPNIIVVCDTGFSTSNFLAEKIKNYFRVNILSIVAAHNLNNAIENLKLDFIVSTIPLKNINVPWIQVNPMFSEKDINNIYKMIAKIPIEEDEREIARIEKTTQSILVNQFSEDENTCKEENDGAARGHNILKVSDLLSEEYILLDKHIYGWKEAIIAAGEPLLWNQKITAQYLKAMVDVVTENGPYIVFAPNVAVAHANSTDGAVEIGVSLLRLATPIEFGHKDNDPVKIVVAFSLTDVKKYLNMFLNVMNILCNQSVINEICDAKTKQDIINIFLKYNN